MPASAFNEQWLTIIKGYENLGPNIRNGIAFPYQGQADKPKNPKQLWPYTCGWGHLMSAQEQQKGVNIAGQLIDVMENGLTTQQCDQLLAQDLAPRIKRVAQAIKAPTPNEFGAFLDVLFNSGPACLTGTPGSMHNEGYKRSAALGMLLYRYAQGVPLLGLWRRRLTDAVYYLSAEVILAKDPASEQVAQTRLEQLGGEPINKPGNLN